jgi:DNA invertase Pin-like site-specific DNA recombinase
LGVFISTKTNRKEPNMNIGYARVSTQDQNLDLQNDALKAAGCENIYTDKMSGAKTERPGLEKIMSFIRKGDTLVVWKLDRLGRSLTHLIKVMTLFNERGVYFKSVQESLDTSTPGGKLIFHVFGALAEFERDIIRERTMAGLAAARARGRVGGRPRKLSKKQVTLAKKLMNDINIPIAEICETLRISKATLYRYVGRAEL